MAFRKTMPSRDPKRAEAEPQHSRDYSASRGGHTRPVEPKPGQNKPN